MTDPTIRDDLTADLAHLLAAGVLSDAVQRAGERLFRRLEANVSIVLAGPTEAAKEYLYDVLITAQLPFTSCRLVPWRSALELDQADVCIWCTSGFDAEEAKDWQHASDRLKDHSFLVAFTDAAPAGSTLPAGTLDHLDNVAAEEFHHFAQVTFGNRATNTPPEAVTTLLTKITELVRSGLAADTDNAHVFVMTHRSKAPLRAPPSKEPVATAIVPLPETAKGTDAVNATALYERALGTMHVHLAGLEPLMEAQQEDEFQEILTICEATSTAVADVLSDSDLREPEIVSIREELLSAADAILLMSSEGGPAPAVSAVTTVLQLRREMEHRIAC